MSLAVVISRAQQGITAPRVNVEVHLSSGLPRFTIVGLPEMAVKESRDRERSAIINSQFTMPLKRITVNLAPADLPKEGGRFDLAIAIGILVASGQLQTQCLDEYEFLGELALTGACRPVQGCLPAAIACQQAGRQLLIATDDLPQVGLINQLSAYGADSLLGVCAHLNNTTPLVAYEHQPLQQQPIDYPDLQNVLGQYHAKRALEIAASGHHNLLMVGPPGTGKTLLASCLPGILPPLTTQQSLEVASIHSLQSTGTTPLGIRPFRQPHHTASAVALVGGGSHPKPGEISLAHHGVLFLDELPEFPRHVLEVLREPLSSKHIHIARARQQLTYPADFQLIAAMNPCPCGYAGVPQKRCDQCDFKMARYQAKLSGPLLDRIDLHVQVGALSHHELSQQKPGEPSHVVRQRVIQAQQHQIQRQDHLNDQLDNQGLLQHAALTEPVQQRYAQACDKLLLSTRAYHRIWRMARTIADMAHQDQVDWPHLQEALSLRGTVNH